MLTLNHNSPVANMNTSYLLPSIFINNALTTLQALHHLNREGYTALLS